MLFLRRKRFFIWLIKAYISKWKKTIIIYFLFGLLIFLSGYVFFKYLAPKFISSSVQTIGLVGSYTIDDLPSMILQNISSGLTDVGWSGIPKPGIAKTWKIENGGKTYIFYLKHNVFFSDGVNLTSDLVQYNFKGVDVQHPDKYTISFTLKQPYAPFLTTVSQPIFKKGLIGIGKYKIKALSLDGDFVKSITLVSVKNKLNTLKYDFYPTQDSLKLAFSLGEVSKIIGLSNPSFGNISFYNFHNAIVKKSIDYNHLVTLFYNSANSLLSDGRLRDALSYALPDKFIYGKRNYTPFNPASFANYEGTFIHEEDLAQAKDLLAVAMQAASQSGSLSLTLQTLSSEVSTAKLIKKEWKKIGINTKIEAISGFPPAGSFQVFLGEFNVPKDPDEYTLWHSDQINNISDYINLRIDQLLESARQTVSLSQREQIYSSFEKYFSYDPAASFLYFPYVYTVTKK